MTGSAPPVRPAQAGFTLVELLITIIVGGIFATGLFAFFFAGTDASRTHESQARSQADARGAIDRMTREIRQAISPDGGVTPPITRLWPTELVMYVDNSRATSSVVPRAARVRYLLVGGDLIRESAAQIPGPPIAYGSYIGREVIVAGAGNGSIPLFTGVEAGGSTLAAPLNSPQTRAIQQVTIRLLSRYKTGNSPKDLEFTTDVTLRNPTT
jgi:prepilin-type N-terminal cleavage/methylation domain-containing protein